MIHAIQQLVYFSSIGAICIVAMMAIVGLIRPKLLKVVLHEFAERKYIVPFGVFSCFLFASIILSTQPQHDSTYASNDTKQPSPAAIQLPTTANNLDITVDEVEAFEPIPYTSQQRSDPARLSGQTAVAQAGVNGQKRLVYTVTKQNGQETSRILKSEAVVTQPTPEIVAVGSAVPQSSQPTAQTQAATPQASAAPVAQEQKNNTQKSSSCSERSNPLQRLLCRL